MTARRSLRTEFLVNLAVLAAAALLLTLWASRILSGSELPVAALAVVPAAVVVIVLLANYLVDRWVLRPLSAIARSADLIAAGEYEHRVPEEGPVEIASLGLALNELTDQLLLNQSRLAENVRSLDETNQRLTEAQRDLVQAEKMASLGQLAAGIAHEIGNPLGALLGYVSVQKRRGSGDPEIVEGMEREARRIDRIVRGLLEYARPGPASREEIDVNASIRRVADLLRSQGWMGGIDLRLDLEGGLPPVLGDPHRTDQIFLNLLRNAESAMGGGGAITVETRRERYEPRRRVPIRRADDPPGVNYSHLRRARQGAVRSVRELEADREVVRVVVTDTGPGIPEEHITSVFDPFFTTKGPGEGTGLGLAIVAGTVADLGGRIEASNAPEGGAVFTLWLPSAAQ
jgi:two-component system, NtrC family, sensor kinase